MFRKGKPEEPALVQGSQDTTVGPGCLVDGDLVVRGSVVVRGEVRGMVQATGDVEIDLGARVRGDVQAERARIGGHVEGTVRVGDALELRQGAHLKGDVHAKSFRIEDGAIFQGNCHMGKRVEIVTPPADARAERA